MLVKYLQGKNVGILITYMIFIINFVKLQNHIYVYGLFINVLINVKRMLYIFHYELLWIYTILS